MATWQQIVRYFFYATHLSAFLLSERAISTFIRYNPKMHRKQSILLKHLPKTIRKPADIYRFESASLAQFVHRYCQPTRKRADNCTPDVK